jgi:hypothetical protein
MSKQLTVQELINELSKFNPNAVLILGNEADVLTASFSWDGLDDSSLPRNINNEKLTANHVTLILHKIGTTYPGNCDQIYFQDF